MFTSALMTAAQEFGVNINDLQVKQFDRYCRLLLEWNEKINLTAITDPEEVAVKHIIDSLSCYDPAYFFQGCRMIDVGTGAGFPGLPLKIAYPDIKLTLVDSLKKRVMFLQQVVDDLGLSNVDIYHGRAEEFARNKVHRENYDIAVSRAVARLNILCEYCLPFVKVKGFFIALKGAQYQAELDGAHQAMNLLGAPQAVVRPVKLPGLDDVRAIIYIEKRQHCPAIYPRKPGIPEKKPL